MIIIVLELKVFASHNAYVTFSPSVGRGAPRSRSAAPRRGPPPPRPTPSTRTGWTPPARPTAPRGGTISSYNNCNKNDICFQLRQQRELVLQQLQPGHEQQPAPGPRAGASPPADQRGRQPRVGVEQRGHPRALVDTLVLSSVICRLLFLFSTSC